MRLPFLAISVALASMAAAFGLDAHAEQKACSSLESLALRTDISPLQLSHNYLHWRSALPCRTTVQAEIRFLSMRIGEEPLHTRLITSSPTRILEVQDLFHQRSLQLERAYTQMGSQLSAIGNNLPFLLQSFSLDIRGDKQHLSYRFSLESLQTFDLLACFDHERIGRTEIERIGSTNEFRIKVPKSSCAQESDEFQVQAVLLTDPRRLTPVWSKEIAIGETVLKIPQHYLKNPLPLTLLIAYQESFKMAPGLVLRRDFRRGIAVKPQLAK